MLNVMIICVVYLAGDDLDFNTLRNMFTSEAVQVSWW